MISHHPTVIPIRYWHGLYLGRLLVPVQSLSHRETLRRISRVAASLRASSPPIGQAPEQQEPPAPASTEGSTAHPMDEMEVRAAGAQSDTELP